MNARSSAPERAINPKASVWVSANAGAGKTYMLANRVTRLLLEGAKPERILCLTYTKAAAAEMANRLFAQLGEWALMPDDALKDKIVGIGAGAQDADTLKRARRLFAQALETPGGLKIQTIHSFCQHVLARFPVEAGIPANFTVLDERGAGELMDRAREHTLTKAAKDEALGHAVATLAVRAADGRFAEMLGSLLGSGRKALAALLGQKGGEAALFARLRTALGIGADDTEESVVSAFCATLDPARLKALHAWLSSGSVNDLKLAELLGRFLSRGDAPDAFDSLRNVFLTKEGEPRARLATKRLCDARPDLGAELDAINIAFLAADERRKAAAIATRSEAMLGVAAAVFREYERLKRLAAALDYDDLTAATLRLLSRAHASSWVLYKLDGGLDHILVDEAQDTSPEQWEVIGKLTEDFFPGKTRSETLRTIFAVGDEKQSIFSFQGAAPEQFAINRDRFRALVEAAEKPFEYLTPRVSRRSATSVLAFVDAVFAAPAARNGLIEAGDDILHEPARGDVLGRVEIWPTIKPAAKIERTSWRDPVDTSPADSPAKQLAKRLAQRIKALIGSELPSSKGTFVTPGDIMILVRRRNAFTENMIRELREAGVPVAGADRMVLSDHIAIADLVALGRFALLPEDDLNLAALLKSPLCGFSETDLFDLAYPRKGALWAEMIRRKDEKPVFAAAHAFLSRKISEADYAAPFEFYARTLGEGMRKKLLARLGHEAADAIDEFLSLALSYEGAHPPSLEGFLDWFGRGASEIKRDMEAGGGAVRVMTVHGAKGLEAEIVILPDTAQVPDNETKASVLYAGDLAYAGVSATHETGPISAAKQAAREAELREYRRLLYVALTRAREWLIVCGYETSRRLPDESWYAHVANAAKGRAREEIDENGETILAFGESAPAALRAKAMAAMKEYRLPSYLGEPAPHERQRPRILRPSEAAGMDEPAAPSPLSAGNETRFKRGLLIHGLLVRLPEVPSTERADAARKYLVRQNVAEAEIAPMIAETLAVLDHPDFAALFSPASRAELTIAADLPELGEGQRISGQIDRLAVTPDEILIADFKTNRPPPESPEHTPALYIAQMALYRLALQKVYPGRRIACVLVWTQNARLMRLPDALLDAEIAKITARLAGIA